MFLDLDKPIPQVRNAVIRRTTTVILSIFVVFPIGILFGFVEGFEGAMDFFKECWKGEDVK